MYKLDCGSHIKGEDLSPVFGHVLPGVSCLSQKGMQRPSMNDVVLMMESALKLQESRRERRESVKQLMERTNQQKYTRSTL